MAQAEQDGWCASNRMCGEKEISHRRCLPPSTFPPLILLLLSLAALFAASPKQMVFAAVPQVCNSNTVELSER